MMNLTLDEERQMKPKLIPKEKRVRPSYFKPKFLCSQDHELAMLYSRMTSTTAITRVPEYFYCTICKKIYIPAVKETQTQCMK